MPTPRRVLHSLVRRAAVTLGALVAVVAALLLLDVSPAMADVPQGWSDPEPMSWGHLLVVIAAIPIGIAVVISVLAALPGLVKGEGLTAGSSAEWLGGPRTGTSELAAPDGEASEAGGASAQW